MQGNSEEQAHTRETKGTNEHDWKETAIFLETSINISLIKLVYIAHKYKLFLLKPKNLTYVGN
jgi:hypothetical protein